MRVRCIALVALVPATLGSIFPVPKHLTNVLEVATVAGTVGNALNETSYPAIDARRRGRKKIRSTSSSSGERVLSDHVKGSGDSLGLQSTGTSDSSDAEEEKDNTPSERGWRKWHRKCTPCPGDMVKKWRDPTIKWICGGYQRARRTFKSECMMFYRNCQDGTMFVKLHDHRCDNSTQGYNGRHFFYDYRVVLPDDTSGKSSDEDSSETSASFVQTSQEYSFKLV